MLFQGKMCFRRYNERSSQWHFIYYTRVHICYEWSRILLVLSFITNLFLELQTARLLEISTWDVFMVLVLKINHFDEEFCIVRVTLWKQPVTWSLSLSLSLQISGCCWSSGWWETNCCTSQKWGNQLSEVCFWTMACSCKFYFYSEACLSIK